jgi:CRISPR/Cas system-associated endonuclease Cas1
MEEFRPPVVDRVMVAKLMRRQPAAVDEHGRLSEATRHVLLRALHERLAGIIRYRGHDHTLQEIIDAQAHALVKHLQEGRPYKSFVSKW